MKHVDSFSFRLVSLTNSVSLKYFTLGLEPEIFSPIFEELKEIFKNDSRFNYLESIFSSALNQSNWSDATRYWVNEIFDSIGTRQCY